MKNRTFSLICLYIFAMGVVYSQKNGFTDTRTNLSKKKNFCEFGAHVYRLDYLPEFSYNSKGEAIKFESNFFRGITFKYYLNKSVLRSSFDYYKRNSMSPWYYNENGSFKKGTLSLGYSYLFLKARFSPYLFTDLSYSYAQRKGYYYAYDLAFSTYIYPANWEEDRRTSEFAVQSGFGLRYNPLRSLVLTAECNLGMFKQFYKEVKTNKRSSGFIDGRLNPLQCSIGFIF